MAKNHPAKYKRNKKKPNTSRRNSAVKRNTGAAGPPAVKLRLNKYIAQCGICSRRRAVDLIKAGEVTVNGDVVTHPAYEVRQDDVIRYKGKVVKPTEEKVYILMNKPKNVITTVKDERGRLTVIDLLRNKVPQRVFPVGRLDRHTTGLLLLTNDGELAHQLSHPSYRMKKIYHVTLDKALTRADMDKIERGIRLEEGIARVDGLYVPDPKSPHKIALELHIGWNRVVRRIFEYLGYEVRKLDRVYYAGLTKKDLKRGWFRHLTAQEVIMLKHFSRR